MGAPLPQAVLTVQDLPAALRFYRDGLGFTATALDAHSARVQAPGGTALVLAAPGADPTAWPGVRRPNSGAWVYLHRPDLPAVAAALQERGMTGDGPAEPYPGFRRLLLTDPDGFVVVFWEPLPLSDEQTVAIYRAGPDRLQQALAGLAPDALDLPWAPGKRTIREIVHHVTDADMGTLHVLHLALTEPGRRISGDVWDDDPTMHTLGYTRRPIEPAVALFAAGRAWVLDALDHLPAALGRDVTWPSGYRAEVRQLLRQAGGHALHHIGQVLETRHRHGR